MLPRLCDEFPRYRNMGLKDLCDKLHEEYSNNGVALLINEMYTALPEQVMTPKDCYAQFVHGHVDCVPIAELFGRVAANMVAPYPPGIPLIMPGERFSYGSESIVRYLKFCEQFDARFPGFEADVHGVSIKENSNGTKSYFVDCITRDKVHS